MPVTTRAQKRKRQEEEEVGDEDQDMQKALSMIVVRCPSVSVKIPQHVKDKLANRTAASLSSWAKSRKRIAAITKANAEQEEKEQERERGDASTKRLSLEEIAQRYPSWVKAAKREKIEFQDWVDRRMREHNDSEFEDLSEDEKEEKQKRKEQSNEDDRELTPAEFAEKFPDLVEAAKRQNIDFEKYLAERMDEEDDSNFEDSSSDTENEEEKKEEEAKNKLSKRVPSELEIETAIDLAAYDKVQEQTRRNRTKKSSKSSKKTGGFIALPDDLFEDTNSDSEPKPGKTPEQVQEKPKQAQVCTECGGTHPEGGVWVLGGHYYMHISCVDKHDSRCSTCLHTKW